MLSLLRHSLLSLLRVQNYKKIRLHTNKIATIVPYGVNNFIILSLGACFFAYSASLLPMPVVLLRRIALGEANLMPYLVLRQFVDFTRAAFPYILYMCRPTAAGATFHLFFFTFSS